ncbi:MAG: hypothetical protein AB7T49_03560 [Oligoflexales bacterium]
MINHAHQLHCYRVWLEERGLSLQDASRPKFTNPLTVIFLGTLQPKSGSDEAALTAKIARSIKLDESRVAIKYAEGPEALAGALARKPRFVICFGNEVKDQANEVVDKETVLLAIPHPQEMLERPELKAIAWKTLQQVIEQLST